MKKITVLSIISIITMIYSCEWLEENTDDKLQQEDVIDGLKKALEIGTDTATTVLGLKNGYFEDLAVKIPLPPDVVTVRNTINGNNTLSMVADILNLEAKFDNAILAINRAAENAASEAAPIFKNAITDLSIADAWDILNGTVPDDTLKSAVNSDFDSTAATQYFINKTYMPLVGLFGPKINTALDQPISSLGFSAVDAWAQLTSTYNNFMSDKTVTSAIALAQVLGTPINLPSGLNEDIGSFCTGKALDGLFYKVGLEEKKIRKNPYQWAVDIIQKVFGSIFKES